MGYTIRIVSLHHGPLTYNVKKIKASKIFDFLQRLPKVKSLQTYNDCLICQTTYLL